MIDNSASIKLTKSDYCEPKIRLGQLVGINLFGNKSHAIVIRYEYGNVTIKHLSSIKMIRLIQIFFIRLKIKICKQQTII